MPRSLAPGSSPTEELRYFTNREQERHVLSRLLALPSGQPLPVVMFYGVGGTGKSWLLRRLRADLPLVIPSALLDFDPLSGGAPYHTDYSRALAELRRQLAVVECPRFDLAYSWLRFHEGVNEEPLLKDKGLAGIATEALSELASGAATGLPLVGYFTNKIAAKLGAKFKGSKLERWLAQKTNQEDLLRLRAMSAQEIYPLLVDRFLLDLAENLPERPSRACRGVLFLDTAEALRIGLLGDAQIHQREQWLRDLHRSDSPVLLVLAGRDRLSWEDADPEYRDRRFLEQHLVGGLSERDSRLFLQHCGITDPSMQQAVLRVSVDTETAATGTDIAYHPFSLGLCADTLRHEPGADPSSFDMAPGDVTRLADRFLKSLADPAYEIWVRRLALTPRFDETAARAAFSANRDVHQDAAWQYLSGFSFFREADEPGWWTLHYRMRQALIDAYPAQAAADHQFWQDHWQRQSSAETGDCAALAWYHQYSLQPKEALDVWIALADRCRITLRMADHYKLLDWWEPTSLETNASTCPETAAQLRSFGVQLSRATLGSRIENLHRAITCYKEALRNQAQSNFLVEWAMTQNNLGIAYAELPAVRRADNLKKAIACYADAQRVFNKTAFPAGWAMVQNNLGNAYADLSAEERVAEERVANLRRAIACYSAALRVYTESEFPVHWAKTQHNLGNAFRDLSLWNQAATIRKAMICYAAALRIRTETHFPAEWARTQNSLGLAYLNPKLKGERVRNLMKAIACFEDALRVRTATDFPADWAMTQNNLGSALEEQYCLTKQKSLLARANACFESAKRGYAVCGLEAEAESMQRWFCGSSIPAEYRCLSDKAEKMLEKI
jgi:tetratricopeptide (TPR) repeat protein